MNATARFELQHNGAVVGVLRHGAVDAVSEHPQDEAVFWMGLRALRGPVICVPKLRPVSARTPIWLVQA